MPTLDQQDLETAFKNLGLDAGDTVFVHSSLSAIGHVEDGADTVIAALLDVLGADGTLAAPAFDYDRRDALFDPVQDPSKMGRISERIRTHSQAHRSSHLYHSVTAIGSKANALTAVHGPAAWAADGPFWQLHALDARILLLGVSYLTCTFFHLIEQLVQVPYRQWSKVDATMRDRDGNERPLPTRVFSQVANSPGNDFNKFGCMLEKRDLVRVQPVGNAIARLFRASDALHLGITEYRKDPLLFACTGAGYAPLADGVRVGWSQSVVDPDAIYR